MVDVTTENQTVTSNGECVGDERGERSLPNRSAFFNPGTSQSRERVE
jgi:hypothetical protein